MALLFKLITNHLSLHISNCYVFHSNENHTFSRDTCSVNSRSTICNFLFRSEYILFLYRQTQKTTLRYYDSSYECLGIMGCNFVEIHTIYGLFVEIKINR